MSATTDAPIGGEISEVSKYQQALQPLTEKKENASFWDNISFYNVNRVINGVAAVALAGSYLYDPNQYDLTALGVEIAVHTYQALLPRQVHRIYHAAGLIFNVAGATIVQTGDLSIIHKSLFYGHAANCAVNIEAYFSGLIQKEAALAAVNVRNQVPRAINDAEDDDANDSDIDNSSESDEIPPLMTAKEINVQLVESDEENNNDDEGVSRSNSESASPRQDGPDESQASDKFVSTNPNEKTLNSSNETEKQEIKKKEKAPTVDSEEDVNANETNSADSLDVEASGSEEQEDAHEWNDYMK